MNPKCVEAVQAAIGRPITVAESRNIEQRVRDAMLSIAREDAARWQSLSQADRLSEGATRAADELVAEAQKKKQRLAATIVAHDRIESYTRAQVAAGNDADRMDAFSRLIGSESDGKNNGTSAESNAKGIVGATMGRLTDAWESIRPGMLGFLANKEAEEQFVRALHGNTRNARPEIVKAAKAWADAAEGLRQRFNAAGGIVGKLDNWGMPHAWSQDLAITAGRKAWLETLPLAEKAIAISTFRNPPPDFAKSAFISTMQKLIDRRRYVHEDGRAYTDDEMGAFLGEAWVTIVTNGANKPIASNGPPGGRSVKANRNSQSRQIHFKDGDAYIEAMREFSGRNVFDVMTAHVKRMSADIALIEQFGPNADLTAQHFIDQIRADEANANPTNAAALEKKAASVANLYDFVAGNAAPPPNRRLANGAAAVRSLLTSSMLGSAAVTSVSDAGTLYLTSRVNNLPLVQVFMNEVRAMNPADRTEKRLAQRAGLLVHTMSDEMDRWGTETLGSHIPDKIASAVMRASGLNAITEARRRAFSVTMMDAIGALTRDVDDVSKLDAGDWKLLRDKGITAEEWGIWRAAKPEPWRGNDTVLTPEAIYAVSDDAMRKAIAPTLGKVADTDQQKITALTERIDAEMVWQQGRSQKLAQYQAGKMGELDQYRARRQQWSAEDQAAVDSVRDVAEAMEAQAKAEAAVARAFREAESQQVLRELLFSVEDGVAADRVAGKLPFAVAGTASRAAALGQKLGSELASARKRVTDASATVRRRAARYESQTGDKAEAIGRVIGKRMAEYQEFVAASAARIDRLSDIARSIQESAPRREAEAIGIARERAASKLLAVVLEEQDIAVIEPGARERSMIQSGTVRGTVKGELVRSFFQFKTFPIAMIARHWQRGMGLYSNTRGRAGYIGTLMAAQTLMGAVAMGINDILSGKDPRNMNPLDPKSARNWLAAFLKGGSVGLYGDFLFAETTQYGQSLLGAVAGPVAGFVEDVDDLTRGNIMQSMRGEDTDAGAEAVKFARKYTPGSSLWYTKAATDRIIFHQMQEYFSPGYLNRMKERARQNYGTTYWWAPGEMPNEARAPDLEKIAGAEQ